MRSRIALAGLVAIATSACATPNQSNGTKMGEALAFATVAAAAQVAVSAAEEKARNEAPVRKGRYGVAGAGPCDDESRYGCVSFAPGEGPRPAPLPELTDAEARDYVLGYLNGVRKLNGAGALVRDDALDAFAQEGAEALAADHTPGGHLATHAREASHYGELQGPADGCPPDALEDQLATVLVAMMNQGRGGVQHDTMLRTVWRRAGVGLAHAGGRTFLTVDLSD